MKTVKLPQIKERHKYLQALIKENHFKLYQMQFAYKTQEELHPVA